MPPRPKTLKQGGWRAFALSLLVHSLIVSAAVFGWFSWKHEAKPMEVLPVEGTLVDASVLKGISTPPKPQPPPPEVVPTPEPEPAPVEDQGPPKPDPAEIERKKEEARLAQEKLEQEKAEAQKREQQKQAQDLKEREQADRLEVEKQAAAKAAADKAATEKALADKKALDKKRAEDAIAAKKAADEKVRQAREAELRRSIEAEERSNAARNSDDAARWHAAIVARITRAWIRPPSAKPGITCSVSVTQVPGGEVTGVRVESCAGGDAALHDSVEAAVYRASPLPVPPQGVPFERTLELTFAPNE